MSGVANDAHSDFLTTPDYTVLSQKVNLDVDFAHRSFSGTTELIVQPLVATLKAFRLHCRQTRIIRATIQGRPSPYTYNDPYTRLHIPRHKTSIRQHEYMRQRVESSLGQDPLPELTLPLPPRVIVKEAKQDALPTKREDTSPVDGNARLVEIAAPADAIGYAPMTISIQFETKHIRDGVHTVGFDPGDSRYPHLYTRNMLFPGTASAIFPCLDTSTQRTAWDISIRCPKTLGDAFPLEIDHDDNRARCRIALSDEDRALDLVVVCSGDMTDEIIDISDESRKTVSFTCTTPVTARHIGFAIGPFEQVDLASEFRQIDEEEKLGQSAVKVNGYCLPGRADELRNTCMPLAMATDYFTVTFGSFPFSSYAICFVDDLGQDTTDTAGLSICSSRMLFSEDQIEPLDGHTRRLVRALASQYSGVSVIPKDHTDLWAITGIAGYMTDIFMKQLAGNNEYRFRQKLASDQVHHMDVDRYSIYQLGSQLDIDPSELDFLWLKSALVLFLLDRRLTKASGSLGMSRIVTRILLNAKTGSMLNSELTTEAFLRTCEKLGHTKLDVFFRQWVYGAGCPDFKVSQRFNRKKLVVEMIIEQAQSKRTDKPRLQPTTFLREAKEQVAEAWVPAVQAVFTGPMTIRIHEADGTPYEHIVEIKEAITRIEIPYNTKYKRLKRGKRAKATAADPDLLDAPEEVLRHCLGDILQSEQDMSDWRLVDWDAKIQAQMGDESYEWIRMDADFEWIARTQFLMPPYMYVSQLQQDRDVVAQYESLQNIVQNEAHPMMSTILIRTLMDRRYYHGIRTAAIKGLAKCATQAVDNIGLFHLEKAFQELFCAPGTTIPLPNDYSDRALHMIRCAIPPALASIRNERGTVPLRIQRFLLDQIKFNDNSINNFSDNSYVATVLTCLANAIAQSHQAAEKTYTFSLDKDDMDMDEESARIKTDALAEIERYRRIDEWIASFRNIYTTTAIACLKTLKESGAVDNGIKDILQFTCPGNADNVRISALSALVQLKIGTKTSMLKYMLHSLVDERSPHMRASLIAVLGTALGQIGIGDGPSDKSQEAPVEGDAGLVLEQDASAETRQADVARTSSPAAALEALQKIVKNDKVLQDGLWLSIRSPSQSLSEITELLDIAALLFDSSAEMDSLLTVIPMPRIYQVRHVGSGQVVFKKTSTVRWKPSPSAPLSAPDWVRVQTHGLKYTGPLAKVITDMRHEPIKLKLGAPKHVPAATSKAVLPMAAPPVPTRTEGPLKISLKRKPSISMSRTTSPKPPKAAKTQASPSATSKSRSPSRNITRPTTPASGSGKSGPNSRIVKLKIANIGHKLQSILSGNNASPKKGLVLKMKGISKPASASSRIALRKSPSIDNASATHQSQAQSSWNFGGFRNFRSGSEMPTTIKLEDGGRGVNSAMASAVSPKTMWPPQRELSPEVDDEGPAVPQALSDADGNGLGQHMANMSGGVDESLGIEIAPEQIKVVKEESSDDEPLMQQQVRPDVGLSTTKPVASAAPVDAALPVVSAQQPTATAPIASSAAPKLGILKLKFGKKT